jgi:hypothetical protein
VDGHLKRGDNSYCQSDYDKTSAEEKTLNKLINKRERKFKQIFDTTR